jgi:hypothetical protein
LDYPIENPAVVDLVSNHPETGMWTLTLVEVRPWGTELSQYRQVQAKVNGYLHYVESGQFARDYPDAENAPIELHLFSVLPLSELAADFLKRLDAAVYQASGIHLRVTVDQSDKDHSTRH